jgi:two-component system, LuxR family, response regulator FixJ
MPYLIGASWKEVTMPVPWGRPPPKQSHKRICIVEDDVWVADSLKLLLETFGFDVQAYNSGTQLLADDQRGPMGCLIIDHHMPGINGLDVVERLREEGVRLPTILISGQVDTNTRARAADLGITSVIEKPFAADCLVALIRSALPECK